MEDQNTFDSPSVDSSIALQISNRIQSQMSKIIVGQYEMIELLLASLLANGHVLIEGVPGVAKTLSARLMAKMLDVGFARIQFTPDLMPSDVTGTSVFNVQQSDFQFRRGPIFSNIVLIDEINRAPAKTQASLFEVMEEKQITIDGHTYEMEEPFMVLATQNPIEHEGTYRLPEAQLDRFLMKIIVSYPSLEEEIKILNQQNIKPISDLVKAVSAVVSPNDLMLARAEMNKIHVHDNIIRYIASITFETRNNSSLYVGASPRASIALLNVAKAIAIIRGRNFVIPEDVSSVVCPVLRHRISLTSEREMDGSTADEVLKEILRKIEIPR